MTNVIILQFKNRVTLNTVIMKKLQLNLLFLFLLGAVQISTGQFVSDLHKVRPNIRNTRAKIFLEMISREKHPQIIDVRTPREYASGHLKGAKLINYYDPNFAKNFDKAGLNKRRVVYIYCRSGHRSANAIPVLKELGFKHIVNLTYGINEWKRLELPLETGMPANKN